MNEHKKKTLEEAFTPRLKVLFDGFYVVGNQCTCEGGDCIDGICGPECSDEDTCPCIAHEVKRLGQVITETIETDTQAPAMRELLERCLAMSDDGEPWEFILNDIKTFLGKAEDADVQLKERK